MNLHDDISILFFICSIFNRGRFSSSFFLFFFDSIRQNYFTSYPLLHFSRNSFGEAPVSTTASSSCFETQPMKNLATVDHHHAMITSRFLCLFTFERNKLLLASIFYFLGYHHYIQSPSIHPCMIGEAKRMR